MDAVKVLSVLDIYARELPKYSAGDVHVKPERAVVTKRYVVASQASWLEKLGHVAWAVEQCRLFVAEGRMEKAFRWLGFIQGALWYEGIYSIDELANQSRPTEEAPNLSPTRNSKSEEWSDEEFLSYVTSHSQTDRALFHAAHVRRLITMAGAEKEYQVTLNSLHRDPFIAIHWLDEGKDLVEMARKRLS